MINAVKKRFSTLAVRVAVVIVLIFVLPGLAGRLSLLQAEAPNSAKAELAGQVYFRPNGGCTEAVAKEINLAGDEIWLRHRVHSETYAGRY
jgi:hypothetical protein